MKNTIKTIKAAYNKSAEALKEYQNLYSQRGSCNSSIDAENLKDALDTAWMLYNDADSEIEALEAQGSKRIKLFIDEVKLSYTKYGNPVYQLIDSDYPELKVKTTPNSYYNILINGKEVSNSGLSESKINDMIKGKFVYVYTQGSSAARSYISEIESITEAY